MISGMEKEAPWKDLKGRIILGRDDFVAKIRGLLGGKEEIKEIPRVERFATRPRLSQIFGERRDRRERDRRLYTAHITYGYTLKEIGDYLRIHYSTVSRAVKNSQRDGNSSKYSRFKA